MKTVHLLMATALVIGTCCGCSGSNRSSSDTTTSDTSAASPSPAADSPDVVQGELKEMNSSVDLLNQSSDAAGAFQDARIESGLHSNDTFTLDVDTDKISTGQDQRRLTSVMLEAWVKAYRDHHGGSAAVPLAVSIDDLSGQEVQHDSYDPRSQ